MKTLLIINMYTTTMINLALQVVYHSGKLHVIYFYTKKEQQTIRPNILTLFLYCPTLYPVYKISIYTAMFARTCSRFFLLINLIIMILVTAANYVISFNK